MISFIVNANLFGIIVAIIMCNQLYEFLDKLFLSFYKKVNIKFYIMKFVYFITIISLTTLIYVNNFGYPASR